MKHKKRPTKLKIQKIFLARSFLFSLSLPIGPLRRRGKWGMLFPGGGTHGKRGEEGFQRHAAPEQRDAQNPDRHR